MLLIIIEMIGLAFQDRSEIRYYIFFSDEFDGHHAKLIVRSSRH